MDRANNGGSEMGTVDAAKAIREQIKAVGIKARSVSVRADCSSIRVLVKDPAVSLATVKAIAGQYEKISRDYASGEILCGGNTFVDVEYTSEAQAILAAPFKAALDALQEQDEFGGSLTEVAPGFHAYAFGGGYVRVYGPQGGCVIHCWGRDFAARQLGALVAEAK